MAITTSTNAAAPTFLNWEDRPDDTKGCCSRAFESVKNRGTRSAWGGGGFGGTAGGRNGERYYWTCGTNEQILFKLRIQTMLKQNPNMRVFNYLDIGAGNFQSVDGMADYINSQTDLPDDIEVHIYGIRGEESLCPTDEKVKRCVKHKLDGFKIEEMSKEFKDRGIDLKGKLDLCVSEWSSIHYVDPAGTKTQACDLIREGGFFLFDGFNLLHQNEEYYPYPHNQNMTQFVIDIGWPFLTMYSCQYRASLNHFLLQKPNDKPCQVPMTYIDTLHIYSGKDHQMDSEKITRFHRPKQKEDRAFSCPEDSLQQCYFGNHKPLHEWLKQNHLIIRESMTWKSIYGEKSLLPIHEAIKKGDRAAFAKSLEQEDINESDEEGNTPLHLTIKYGHWDLFQKLIDLKADVNLTNGQGERPIDIAARFDRKGGMVGQLIEAGAEFNFAGQTYRKKPIDAAIETKNLMGLKALLLRNAIVSQKNYKDLKAPEFSWLFTHGGVDKPLSNSDLENIDEMIKDGHCVVLHYNGYNGLIYYTGEKVNPDLVVLNINPETNLLGEGEWPSFLEGLGHRSRPYDYQIIEQLKHKKERHFSIGYKKLY